MKTSVPFTAFCPECNGHRTFTIIRETSFGSRVRAASVIEVGCCVCGTTERDAFAAVSDRMQDDRATIGEMAARLNTLDGEVTELRDEVHALSPSPAVTCAICGWPREQHWRERHMFSPEGHSVKA